MDKELFAAQGDTLLKHIKSGATRELSRATPDWTSTDAREFKTTLTQLWENVQRLEEKRIGQTNSQFVTAAKLDLLKAASKLDKDLFKKFNEEIRQDIQSFGTDVRRLSIGVCSLPNRLFMRLYAWQVAQDEQRNSR